MNIKRERSAVRTDFHEVLGNLRKGAGWTQTEAAEKCGFSQGKWSTLETKLDEGKLPRFVADDDLNKIASTFKIRKDVLLHATYERRSIAQTHPRQQRFEDAYLEVESSRLAKLLDLDKKVRALWQKRGTSSEVYDAQTVVDFAKTLLTGTHIGEIRPVLVRLAKGLSCDPRAVRNDSDRRRILFDTWDIVAHINSFLEKDSVDSQSNKELAHLVWLGKQNPDYFSRYQVRLGDQLKNAAITPDEKKKHLELFRWLNETYEVEYYPRIRSFIALSVEACKSKNEFERDLALAHRKDEKFFPNRPTLEQLHIDEQEALSLADACNRFEDENYRTRALKLFESIKFRFKALDDPWAHMEFAVRLQRLEIFLATKGILDHLVTGGTTKAEVVLTQADKVRNWATKLGSKRVSDDLDNAKIHTKLLGKLK